MAAKARPRLLLGGLVVLVIGSAAEIVLLTVAARQIGLPATVGLLLLGALAGGWMVKRAGTRAWRAAKEAADAGPVQARNAAGGVVMLLGGLLLMLPGFLSDVLGLLTLVPAIRRKAGGATFDALARRFLPAELADTVIGPRTIKARRVRRTAQVTGPADKPGQ